jgi:hypothetical protein
MSALQLDLMRLPGNGIEVIAGSFAPDTANPPTAVRGRGFTVAYTSTGLWTVTLENKYNGLIAGMLTLGLAAAADQKLQFGTVTISSAAAATFQIRCVAVAALSQIAADANNRINFMLILKKNGIVDGTGIT